MSPEVTAEGRFHVQGRRWPAGGQGAEGEQPLARHRRPVVAAGRDRCHAGPSWFPVSCGTECIFSERLLCARRESARGMWVNQKARGRSHSPQGRQIIKGRSKVPLDLAGALKPKWPPKPEAQKTLPEM